MMRVTRIEAVTDVPTLRVEGRLTHETVEELRTACDAVCSEQPAMALDVSGLQYVDPAGVALLHQLEEGGTQLTGSSGFVGELLRSATVAPAPSMPASITGEELALIDRLRAGDAAAFEELVRRYGGRLLAVARRFVSTDADANDILQDAFLAAFRAIESFNGGARLSTWLHRIVVNAALMRLRTKRRRPEESIDELFPRFDDTGHFTESPTDWEETATDALYEQRQTRATVRRAIEQLPAGYRTVLLLRDIEELDTDETATLLGVTPNAVKTRLHRARQALRTLLDRSLAPALRASDVG